MSQEKSRTHGFWKPIESSNSLPLSRGSILVGHAVCADLGDRILELINSAKRSLWIASPIIDDRRVVDAIVKARSRRVSVKVITDIRNNRGRGSQYLTRGFEATSSEATKLESHQLCIRELAKARVSCRSPTHYPHFKLVMADDESVLLSSANLTANSLGCTPSSSLEVGALIIEQNQIGVIVSLLTSLWATCPVSLHLSDSDVSIRQHGSGECIVGAAQAAAMQDVLVNSPGEGYFSLTDSILNCINASTNELVIASMSFYGANEVPALEDALMNALARRVQLTSVIRLEHFREQEKRGEYPDESMRRLIAAGLELKGIRGLHAKGLLADNCQGLIFSANINPFSLTSELESHQMEMGLALAENGACFTNFSSFMLELQEAATHQFVLA